MSRGGGLGPRPTTKTTLIRQRPAIRTGFHSEAALSPQEDTT
jgi:hypothetical protein